MKTKQASLGMDLISGAVLYREDLDTVVTLLSDKGYRVKISDSNHEYETLDEAREHLGERPKELSIEGRETSGAYDSVHLYMLKEDVRVMHARGDRADSVSHDICALARVHQSRLFQVLSPLPWIVCCGLVGSIFGRLIATPGPVATVIELVFGFLAAGTAWAFLFRRSFTTARLVKRHAGGFWRRNGEKLLLVALGAAMSEVLRLLFGLLGRDK